MEKEYSSPTGEDRKIKKGRFSAAAEDGKMKKERSSATAEDKKCKEIVFPPRRKIKNVKKNDHPRPRMIEKQKLYFVVFRRQNRLLGQSSNYNGERECFKIYILMHPR